jgi:hypothetical protein
VSVPADGDGAPIEGVTLGPNEQPPEPAETIQDDGAPLQAPFTRVRIQPPRKWLRVGSWRELLECPACAALVSGQRGAHIHLQAIHSDDRTGQLIEWAEGLWDEVEEFHGIVAEAARRRPPSDRRRMWGPEWWRKRGHSPGN